MRICMLLYGSYPAEPRTRRAAEALAGAGHHVTVLALRACDEAAREDVGGVRVIRVASGAVPDGRSPVARKLATFGAMRAVRRAWATALEGEAFDVVQANNADTLAFGAGLASRVGAKLVYDAHELWVEYVTDRGHSPGERLAAVPTRLYWTAIERRLIPRADLVTTVNEFIAREMAQRYRCAQPDVVLNVPPTPAGGVEELPVDLPGVRFIYQGVFSQGRGLPELLDAIAEVPEASVCLMGDGVLRADVERRAAEPDLAGRAAVLAPVTPERVVPLARSAHVGVVPFQPTTLNNYYASPNKLFEYLHAGLPVLGTELPFLSAVLEETGAGITVPTGGSAPMVEGIRRLALDDALRARLAAAAAAAASRYSWESESRHLLALYDTLAV